MRQFGEGRFRQQVKRNTGVALKEVPTQVIEVSDHTANRR